MITRRAFLGAILATASLLVLPAAAPLQEPVDEQRPSLETSWEQNGDIHTVKTDCTRYPSLTQCATAHKRAIEIMKKVLAEDGVLH